MRELRSAPNAQTQQVPTRKIGDPREIVQQINDGSKRAGLDNEVAQMKRAPDRGYSAEAQDCHKGGRLGSPTVGQFGMIPGAVKRLSRYRKSTPNCLSVLCRAMPRFSAGQRTVQLIGLALRPGSHHPSGTTVDLDPRLPQSTARLIRCSRSFPPLISFWRVSLERNDVTAWRYGVSA
jgi:hypothetical protein